MDFTAVGVQVSAVVVALFALFKALQGIYLLIKHK